MAFNYHRTLQAWAVPLLLAAALAYLVAHSFLSVFQAVLGALLLCVAADLHTNDGSPAKPYFMDHELLVSTHRTFAVISTLTGVGASASPRDRRPVSPLPGRGGGGGGGGKRGLPELLPLGLPVETPGEERGRT